MYGYIGSMKTLPGKRESVMSILASGADRLRELHCQLYVVAASNDDDVTIWVTEAWRRKEDHDASLQLPEVKAAIVEVMPLLTGEFTSVETTIVGGLGVPSSA